MFVFCLFLFFIFYFLLILVFHFLSSIFKSFSLVFATNEGPYRSIDMLPIGGFGHWFAKLKDFDVELGQSGGNL
jgi:hypothetical protein